jgi:hypothetical protein
MSPDDHEFREHPPDFSLVWVGRSTSFCAGRTLRRYDSDAVSADHSPLADLLVAPSGVVGPARPAAWRQVRRPLLLHAEVHVRFLVVIPLLSAAEPVAHRRMLPLVALFLERDLIADEDLTRFKSSIASAMRLRNSLLAEMLLIAVVYAVGSLVIWRHYTALSVPTWYSVPVDWDWSMSLAGIWFAFVSLPLLQFLLIR